MMRPSSSSSTATAYLDVGGARAPIRTLAVQLDLAGEISAIEVCLMPPQGLDHISLESVLGFGVPVRLVLRRGVVEITITGYRLVGSSTDSDLVCYTLYGGTHAFNGIQPRQG